jgi:hypothetical protein
MDTAKLKMRELSPSREQMHMGFDEAGQDRTALGVDHLRGRSLEFFDGDPAANGDDGAILDGNGLGYGIATVHGQHTTIDDDQIRIVTRTRSRHRDSALLMTD